MRRQFHTKDGIEERDLLEQEVLDLAAMGDRQATKELVEKMPAETTEERLFRVEKLLGLR